MMPDLGKYTGVVTAAYGAAMGLLLLMIVFVLWRSFRTRRALEAQEARQNALMERKDG